MDDKREEQSIEGDGKQQFVFDEEGEKGVTIMRENVDGSEVEDPAQIDSKQRKVKDDMEDDLDFQIEENSSDHRQPNHSSTAADNFQDLGAFSSQSSTNQQNHGQGMGSPSSHGDFGNMKGGKKKSTTPIGINKNQDIINFDIAKKEGANPQRSVSQHQLKAAGKGKGLLGEKKSAGNFTKIDMAFQTNDLNQDTVIIKKKQLPAYKHSDTPTVLDEGGGQDEEDGSGEESVLTFDEHMWDHLPEIQHHSQQGSKMLKEFATFCKAYSNAVTKFGAEVRKAHDVFQRHLTQQSKKNAISNLVDHNYFGYSGRNNRKDKQASRDEASPREPDEDANRPDHAMSMANDVMKKAMTFILKQVDEKVKIIGGDLVEPLELYISHHEHTSQQQFDQARQIFHDYYEKQTKHKECKKHYMNLGHESEQLEIEIEKALLSQQQGDVSVEKVQEVMNKSLQTKYKVQVALKNYKESIDELNQAQFDMENEYRPILQQIQQYEESRINFIKYNYDKFLKQAATLAPNLEDQEGFSIKQLQNQNCDVELTAFIQQHLTENRFPSDNIEFEPFQISDDLQRYKAFLADQTKELKAQSDNKLQEVMDMEKTKQSLFECIQNIIFHSKITDKTEEEIVPSKEELSKLILAFHEKDMRMKITEVLKGICTQRCVVSLKGLQTLGELIKYLLTAIIHEKDVNFKVIYAILNSSQLLYYQSQAKFPSEVQGENPGEGADPSQAVANPLSLSKRRLRIRATGQYSKKYYLTQYVNDHGIWQEENIWKSVLQKVLNQKFQEAVQKDKERRNGGSQEEQDGMDEYKQKIVSSATSFMGNINQLGKTFKGVWGGKESAGEKSDGGKGERGGRGGGKAQTMRIPKILAQNIIFNTISNFMFHFINFKYSLTNSKEVVLYFCKRYELDQSRTHLLLSELESAQNNAHLALTQEELSEISRDKMLRRKEKCDDNKYLIILSMSLKFIGCNSDQGSSDLNLLKFVQLNKVCHRCLVKQVYKQALVYETDSKKLTRKRVALWKKLLGVDLDSKDYYAFRDKVNSANNQDRIFEDDGEYYQMQTLKSSVSELIAMDVQRSFHNLRHIVKPEILKNILKTYAFFNPEIEYCQGMNFVAGFLFLVFRDEQLTFKALMRVAEIFDMSHLYKKELPKLKLFFYQLDRLIAMKLPQLHQHFKDEQINSGIFASAWFITQFTNSLQIQDKKFKKNNNNSSKDVGSAGSSQPEQQKPADGNGAVDEEQNKQESETTQYISDNLLQLWDYFISSGWKAIFKMSLYILKANEEKLLQLGFEDILNQISEQPKLILSGDCQQIDKMEEELFAGRAVGEGLEGLDNNPDVVFDDSNDPNLIITLYMRFKRGLDQDEEGNFLHMDYLMEKFKREFDNQLQLSEVRKEKGFDE